MPNLKASIKDVRKAKKRRARNLLYKKNMKRAIKEFVALVSSSDKEKAQKLLPSLYKIIDKVAKKNIIHKNTAARKKSQLAKMLAKG